MQCAVCGSEMRQIPAGVSKSTGIPYSAFMACPNKCKQPRVIQPQVKKEPDWEKISRGKVRHGLVCAMIQAGWEKEKITGHLLELENIVMHGVKEEEEIFPPDAPF